MIDVYHSRRDRNLRCEYFKASRDPATGRLSYGEAPSGVFYARYETGRYAANSQAANVFQFEVSSIAIGTTDEADLSPNDLVRLEGEDWIVQNAQKVYERKNQYRKEAEATIIHLRKGT